MPPFRRKTLVLIGAQGVGRRSLKNKLILWDPDRYGTTVPCEWEPALLGGVRDSSLGPRAASSEWAPPLCALCGRACALCGREGGLQSGRRGATLVG